MTVEQFPDQIEHDAVEKGSSPRSSGVFSLMQKLRTGVTPLLLQAGLVAGIAEKTSSVEAADAVPAATNTMTPSVTALPLVKPTMAVGKYVHEQKNPNPYVKSWKVDPVSVGEHDEDAAVSEWELKPILLRQSVKPTLNKGKFVAEGIIPLPVSGKKVRVQDIEVTIAGSTSMTKKNRTLTLATTADLDAQANVFLVWKVEGFRSSPGTEDCVVEVTVWMTAPTNQSEPTLWVGKDCTLPSSLQRVFTDLQGPPVEGAVHFMNGQEKQSRKLRVFLPGDNATETIQLKKKQERVMNGEEEPPPGVREKHAAFVAMQKTGDKNVAAAKDTTAND